MKWAIEPDMVSIEKELLFYLNNQDMQDILSLISMPKYLIYSQLSVISYF
jgi:hypothetical protein